MAGHHLILGTGIDICQISRLAGTLQRHGQRFLDRIYTDAEQSYCRQFSEPQARLAARFASKEAFSKAIGTGIGRFLAWKDCQVGRKPGGAPTIVLTDKPIQFICQRFNIQPDEIDTSLSISHDGDYAIAHVILMQLVKS